MAKRTSTMLMLRGHTEEALNFYVTLFDGAQITYMDYFGPEDRIMKGKVRLAHIDLLGQSYLCTDSPFDPQYPLTPAISIYVECTTKKEFKLLLDKLSVDGDNVVPVRKVDDKNHFGWVQDRFGLSWQINYAAG